MSAPSESSTGRQHWSGPNALADSNAWVAGLRGDRELKAHTKARAEHLKTRLNFESLRYPLDVEGPEESHWIRFEPVTIEGVPLRGAEGANETFTSGVGPTSALDRFASEVGKQSVRLAVTAAKGAALNALNRNLSSKAKSAITGVAAIGESLGFSLSSKTKTHGSITLYLPQNLIEDYRPNWQGGELGILGARAAEHFGNEGIIGGAVALMSEGLEVVRSMGSSGGSGDLHIKNIMGNVVGSMFNQSNIGAKILKGASVAINPHLEAFFKGIDFRRFSFTFKMAPRSSKEAEEIQNIIKQFKYFSAPDLITSTAFNGAFFDYPQAWNIKYYNEDKMHKFKHCALTGISLNRTGGGMNSMFNDGHPVETDMTLNFMELEIVGKTQFDEGY